MPRPRAQYSGSRSLASMARPIFTYVAVVSSVLIALMFVVNPMLEKGTRAVVTSDRVGLPKPWHPDSIQTLAAAPAPAPDMTSPLVLAAAPKTQSAPEVVAKVEPATRAARVEATHKKKRVTSRQPPDDYRQSYGWSRDRYPGPFGGGTFFGRF
ncbi:MAG: hypothetical protein WB496_02380 [Pseudolabrys sp.]